DKNSFKDRYTRQSRGKPCSTIVAHLSKDGLMFIHPRQHRSLTPREAARVQSFPDWFVFPKAQTHAYRMIGNAVPPLAAEAIGDTVAQFLANTGSQRSAHNSNMHKSELTAARLIEPLLDSTPRQLRVLPAEEFLAAWQAIFFLYPGLHPDERDHGIELT